MTRHRMTRITVVSSVARADVVVPADEPVGTVLPELVRLAGGPSRGSLRSLQLTLADGRPLSTEQSLGAAGVLDGAVVRLDDSADAPPPAVVYDVADEVADDLAGRRGRWDLDAQTAAAAVFLGFAFIALAATLINFAPGVLIVVIGGCLLAAGILVSLTSLGRLGFGLSLGGAGATTIGIIGLNASIPMAIWFLLFNTAAVLVAFGGAFRQLRSCVIGAAMLVGVLLLWLAVTPLPLSWPQRATVVVVLSLLLVGLLPRLVIMTAGLTRLDDQRSEGQPVIRSSVAAAINSAHRTYALAMIVAAGSAGVAAYVSAVGGSIWGLLLGLSAAIVLVLRTRACALTSQVVGLLIAAALALLGTLLGWQWTFRSLWFVSPMIAGIIGGAAFIVLGQDRETGYERALWRRAADRIEMVVSLALVPITIGALGVYGRMLELL